MNKKIIAAAIAASFVAPAAMADVTVYGKVKQSLDYVDTAAGTDEWQINDRSSRIGFKGSEDLGNGLKAIYKIEYNVQASTNGSNGVGHVNAGDNNVANRNQYVGLAGDFGTFLIGRHDSPANMAWSKNNIFGDTAADLKGNPHGPMEWERIDGTIAYVSPSFNGLTIAAAIVPDETTYNPTGGDGLADHFSIAGMYSNGGLYVALAHTDLDVTGADFDETVFAINYKMDAFKVGLTYEDAEDGANDTDTIQGFVTYTMGNNVLKAQIWDKDSNAAAGDADGWAIGLDHNFSKRTQVQVTYVDTDADAGALSNDLTGRTLTDGETFSLQLNHSF